MLVLLVEGDEETRVRLARAFAGRGMLVETAANGTQAVTKATLVAPDAIVMDLALPRGDGWTAVSRLKSSLHTSSVPILAMSARVGPQARLRVLEAGCEAVIAKPCAPEDVIAALRSLTRVQKRTFRPLPPVSSVPGHVVRARRNR
jgi:CheY-like chemotaxis protein